MMRSLVLVAVLAAAVSGCASTPHTVEGARARELHVGVGVADITPDEPIRLTGYGSRTVPTGDVRQRLRAKALAFGDGRTPPSLLITTDLIGVPRQVAEEVARRLASAGIRRPQLALTATHTHTGPMLAGTLPYIFGAAVPAEQQAVSARYTHALVERLERAARAALADMRPARVRWGVGRLAFAANRRVLEDGKWVGFGVNEDGPVDHDLSVLAAHGPDEALRAVLVNYACHATTLEGKDNFVHGDWPGAAQEAIERRHSGAVALISIGTGADANPNPRGGGLPDVERHGQAVAAEVERLLAGALRPITAPPAGRFRTIDLSYGALPDVPHWRKEAERSDPNGMFARAMLAQFARRERLASAAPYAIQTWTFGSELAMVFLAGEVVADYSLRLKRELDGSRLWITAYANDVPFYVPSRRMIPEGGYEVDRSMVYYGHPAPLAADTEDRIVSTVHELLPPAFRRAGR